MTYPNAYRMEMTGKLIKEILEDVADNLFNPDPYYQQGGDMVRVGGMGYRIDVGAKMGSRISDMTLLKTGDAHRSGQELCRRGLGLGQRGHRRSADLGCGDRLREASGHHSVEIEQFGDRRRGLTGTAPHPGAAQGAPKARSEIIQGHARITFTDLIVRMFRADCQEAK
jgi:hypothetical protein